MALVPDLIDRLRALQSGRGPWETHWRDIATYALPDAERFDTALSGGRPSSIDAVVSTPVAAERGRAIYDTTSLWAIDRGAAGTLSLVTPQSGTWFDIGTSDPFGTEPSDEEKRWYEQLRDYLFAVRANPKSGFWTSHKAAMRCVWAFGTAVCYSEESTKGVSSPISYRFIPLSENHLATNFEGVVDTNYRLFNRTARQCVERWGGEVSAKVRTMAASEKDKDKAVTILHAVYPREESGSRGSYGRNKKIASCYVEIDEKHLIGEGGYDEFPYRIDHWQRNNPGPYAEGPIALALADIKSQNMLAKSELRAVQQWTDPPIATPADTGARLNLNPRAVNPGYMTMQGHLLAAPIVTAQRPDFARAILDARREQLSRTLYIDVWQTIIEHPNMTATEALIRANEKGDLLGPVGTSLQIGLAFQVDRDVGILARQGAFEEGSPLAPPVSLRGRETNVRFTSPLDKLRRIPQLQGMSQLMSLVATAVQLDPSARHKINVGKMIDESADILQVPMTMITPDADYEEAVQRDQAAAGAQTGIAMTQGAGDAATAAATGAQSIANSPAASEILKRLAGVTGMPAQ